MKLTKAEQTQLLEKHNQLANVKETLKAEFFGIEEVIDELIEQVEPWLLFADDLKRPLVVNLWGMTGVGKTSLVKRLVELLGQNDDYCRFDIGEYCGDSNSVKSLKYDLHDKLDDLNGKNMILCFDEFQHGRTVDERGTEIDRDKLRVVWDLLDTGRFTYLESTTAWDIYELRQLVGVLEMAIAKGLAAKNGRIVSKREAFIKAIKKYCSNGPYREDISVFEKSNLLIPMELYSDLVEVCPAESSIELHAMFIKMNEKETVNYLQQVLRTLSMPKEMNLSTALIFIAGNLDEVFQMSNQLSPDDDADLFYYETRKITVPEVKDALRKRFRNEQIARMGNNHIIYPSLSRKAYEHIISQKLNEVQDYFQNTFGLGVEFAASVNRILYLEGVFPAQGARPLLTTFNYLIEGFVGKILKIVALNYPKCDFIEWGYDKEQFTVGVYSKPKKKLGEQEFEVKLKVNSLRRVKDKEITTKVAVHEAGHAVVASLRTRVLPDEVRAVTADARAGGFCRHRLPDTLLSKKNVADRIAVLLGGYCAERMVFGEEHAGSGVMQDIERATQLANEAIKSYGMNGEPIAIQVPTSTTNDHLFNTRQHQKEVKELMMKLKKEADELLSRNKSFLFELATYLIDNHIAKKVEIEELAVKYANERWVKENGFIPKEQYYQYEELLRKAIEKNSCQELFSKNGNRKHENGIALHEAS